MTSVESGIREMLDLVNSQRSEIDTLRAQLEDFRASQHYRYIGADGKTVLARDLEDERDRLRRALGEIYEIFSTPTNTHIAAQIAKEALK